jgi:prophage regulatory protein
MAIKVDVSKLSPEEQALAFKLSRKHSGASTNHSHKKVNDCTNEENPQSSKPKRLLRLRQVLDRFPVSRSHFYAGIKKGVYPSPTKAYGNMSMWDEGDIELLIAKSEEQ